jgi:alkanesulfonate monooxygenase SsuD/methylene tetrahydromethanopterin reductase-like flavin-dependent oxidoreductase (luciferase family)
MKFGLAVTGRANPKILQKLAVKADELGYDCFLVTDHFMLPSTNNHIDAWSFLSYLAALTKDIRLGTCVTPIPFRPPVLLAKMVSTTDYLSKGRVILGAGFGWFQPEFEGFSEWLDPRSRAVYTEEALQLMTELWTSEEPVDFQGKFVHARGAVVEPKPVQKPHPDIWFGGLKSQGLRIAATYCQGWIPIGPRWFDESYPRPEQYSEMRAKIIEKLKEEGRSEKKFVFTCLINNTNRKTLSSDVEQYIDAGMNYFTLGEKAQSEDSLKSIKKVAKEVGRSL